MSFPPSVASRQTSLVTPPRVALALVALVSLLHLAAGSQIALSVDEAHYALYGLHLDWSYFDHPPLVGWLQALVLPFSHADGALRLWPIVLAALASLTLYRLTQALFPNESPWLPVIALALLQSAVLFQVISMALVPEDPLLLFGLAGMLMFHRALASGRRSDWLVLGAFLGLAGLSKYTAIVLVFSIVIILAVERRFTILRRPEPWIAAALAVLVVVPVVAWNARHDWISFAYQMNHGAPEVSWSPLRFLRSAAGQVVAFGGMVIVGAWALAVSYREWREEGVRFLALFALPLLLLFAWSGGFEETLPHWTLLGWAAAAPLAARGLLRAWPSRAVRIGVGAAVVYSLALTLAIHAQFVRPWIPFTSFAHPLGDLYGWREAGERARELGDENRLPLMVRNWTHASRIAWYAQRPVQVLDSRVDQFDLWYGNPARGSDAILILPQQMVGDADNGMEHFSRCLQLDSYTYFQQGKPVHSFFYFLCKDYRGES